MRRDYPISRDIHPQIIAWWDKGVLPKMFSATREGFGQGLLIGARRSKKVVALTANLGGSTHLSDFHKYFPDRFLEVGVAEQSLAGVAAGVASEGFVAVATSFAVFSPGRNWDFIRTQIAAGKLPVVIVGSHAGLATGPDGGTHQALEDVALMRSLPNMTVISPADSSEASAAIRHAIKRRSPVYLRLVREKTPVIFRKDRLFKPASWLIRGNIRGDIRSSARGARMVLVSSGAMLWNAVQAAKMLYDTCNLRVGVLHVAQLHSLPKKDLRELLLADLVFTVEDHNIIGGLGSAIAEFLAEKQDSPRLVRLGVRESFGRSGSVEDLYREFGLDVNSIALKVVAELSDKRRLSSLRNYIRKQKNKNK